MAATIPVSHKGKNYAVQVDLTNTVSSFQAQLEELTSVPVDNQKLLFKGKRTAVTTGGTLGSFGLKDGVKVQMLGSTTEDISGLRAVEDEKKRTEQTLRYREIQARVRATVIYNHNTLTDDDYVSHSHTPRRPLDPGLQSRI